MYMSLMIYLVLIKPCFLPRIVDSLQKKIHFVAILTFPETVGIRYSTKRWICQHKIIWFTCVSIRKGLRAEAQFLASPNHYLKISVAMFPVCWHQQILLVGSSPLSWMYLLILTALFPSLSHSSELLLNSESHSPSLVIVRDSLLWNMPCWKYKWYVVDINMELFLIIWRRPQPVIFIFINLSGHLQLTRFYYFFFSDKGSQTLTNSCWLMSSTMMWSILISRGQRKAAAFPCPFHIPMTMSLGWLLHTQKAVESQREFCTWKGFRHEMQQEPAAALNELQSNKRCIAYPMNKWYSICDILWVFWTLAGILIASLFT